MDDRKIKLLLVDDDAIDLEVIERLADSFYEILTAVTVKDAISVFEAFQPDCAIIDYNLPDGDGMGLIRAFGASPVALIMLTGQQGIKGTLIV